MSKLDHNTLRVEILELLHEHRSDSFHNAGDGVLMHNASKTADQILQLLLDRLPNNKRFLERLKDPVNYAYLNGYNRAIAEIKSLLGGTK